MVYEHIEICDARGKTARHEQSISLHLSYQTGKRPKRKRGDKWESGLLDRATRFFSCILRVIITACVKK